MLARQKVVVDVAQKTQEINENIKNSTLPLNSVADLKLWPIIQTLNFRSRSNHSKNAEEFHVCQLEQEA